MKKSNIKNNIVLFSNDNNEPNWIKEYRINAYKKIDDYNHPSFGPEIKLDIDLNIYFENKSIPFHIERDGFIACDIHTAFDKYSSLVEKYYSTLISSEENRYTILNSTVFESGYFIYVPKNKKLEFPVFNKNTNCDFTKNIIIVDENAELSIVDIRNHCSNLSCDCTEIFVEKDAKCRYLNMSISDEKGVITSMKRAQVAENASMDWVNVISGPAIYMGYPSTILKGNNSTSINTTLSVLNKNKSINVGAKMIHEGCDTTSEITNVSVIEDGGELEIRNFVNIKDTALNSSSNIDYEYCATANNFKYDNVPRYVVNNDSSNVSYKVNNNSNLESDIVKFIEKHFIKLSDKNNEILQKLINGSL